MPDRMSEYMSNRISEYILDKLSGYMEYLSKYIFWNIMVGIIWNKEILNNKNYFKKFIQI